MSGRQEERSCVLSHARTKVLSGIALSYNDHTYFSSRHQQLTTEKTKHGKQAQPLNELNLLEKKVLSHACILCHRSNSLNSMSCYGSRLVTKVQCCHTRKEAKQKQGSVSNVRTTTIVIIFTLRCASFTFFVTILCFYDIFFHVTMCNDEKVSPCYDGEVSEGSMSLSLCLLLLNFPLNIKL